jgi:hypothetical protein
MHRMNIVTVTQSALKVLQLSCLWLLFAVQVVLCQGSNPLDIPEAVESVPTIHFGMYGLLFGSPEEQLGLGGGFMVYNDTIQIGIFVDYAYLASGHTLTSDFFSEKRSDAGDIGVVSLGLLYISSQLWSIYAGYSFGTASMAVAHPDEDRHGNIEMAWGVVGGMQYHPLNQVTIGGGVRYYDRYRGGASAHDAQPSTLPNVWSYEIRFGLILVDW